ncbi:MAG TPA: hypothetical protein VGN10_19180 [Pyrinomonadaceae bacterium]
MTQRLVNDPKTFARVVLKSLTIENHDLGAAITNQTCPLQRACCCRYTSTRHVGEFIERIWTFVLGREVVELMGVPRSVVL